MRYLHLFLTCAGLSLGLAEHAHADSNTVPSGVVVKVDGAEVDRDLKYVYQNAQHCTDNVPISIQITEAFKTNQVLEVWVGPNGTDCSKGTNRNKPANGNPPCQQVAIDNGQKPGTQPTVDVTSLELFGSDDSADDDGGTSTTCQLENIQWVYVMALATSSQDTGSPDAETGNFKRVGFYVDVNAPDAPGSVSKTDGETVIRVKWTPPNEIKDDVDARIRVYYDPTPVPKSDTCTSSVLVPGELPESDGKYQSEVGTSTELAKSPGSFGLSKAQTMVPVAVASVDAAGNVSELSELVCVALIDTEGFDEVCQKDPECRSGLDSCSTTPWRVTGASGGIALALMGLVLVRRRRRNV